MIDVCGLDACADLVALATPTQLVRLFDLDVWRGVAEAFDAERFCAWLAVLVEAGDVVAARTLAELDLDLVVAGFAGEVRILDRAAATDHITTDGMVIPGIRHDDRLTADLAGFVVVAQRGDAWDAVTAALAALEAYQPDRFMSVMSGLRTLSNSSPELDGLDDLADAGSQVILDARIQRERRRDRQGYVAAGDAHAFLEMSRRFRTGTNAGRSEDPIARAHFRSLEETRESTAAVNVLATGTDDESAVSAAAIADVLAEAGIIDERPKALLAGATGPTPRLAHMRRHMAVLLERDLAAYAARNEDLAFLANTIAAGCSIQARPFTTEEAWNAAVAACNLGLETLAAADGFLGDRDLIGVFQAGWTTLYDDVAMYAATGLVDVLGHLRCPDRDVQAELDQLRKELIGHMRAGTPWRARDAMEVLASLDMPAWAALVGLIDECPVLHGAIAAARDPRQHAVSASAFEFISERSQVAAVRAFVESLPSLLSTHG